MAVLAAEAASFPRGERFGALCTAADGVTAQVMRLSSDSYGLIEYGTVVGGGPKRLQTSDRRFNNRAQWADALADLGERLPCAQVIILFPSTDALPIEIDADGKHVRKAT